MTIFDPGLVADALLEGKIPTVGEWELAQALDELTRRIERAGDASPQPAILQRALKALNDRRLFAQSVRLGEVACRQFPDHAVIPKHTIQALIDSGDLEGARRQLERADGISMESGQRLEIQGLWGRLFKQDYIRNISRTGSGDPALLRQAIDHYLTAFEQASGPPPHWHGVNAIALLIRAAKDGISHPRSGDAKAMAKRLRDQLAREYRRGQGDIWACASAAEACVALEKVDEAELWMYRYVCHPQITPFNLGSTHRQFSEIWGLDGRSGGLGQTVLILEQQMARRGAMQLETTRVARGADAQEEARYLEKVYGKERFMGYEIWEKALRCCSSVARVEGRNACGVGTGFLVRGSDLSPRLPSRAVFVTNAHVISPNGAVAKSLKPEDARVRFEVESRRLTNYVPATVASVIWSSPPGAIGISGQRKATCDTTVALLEGLPPDAPVLEIAGQIPRLSATSRAYVIGHPDGDGLQVSLHDSELIDVDDLGKLVHYRTPTVGGNSGSPVFDCEWRVFAVHHAGSDSAPRFRGEGSYQANEGISLEAIRDAIAASPPAD